MTWQELLSYDPIVVCSASIGCLMSYRLEGKHEDQVVVDGDGDGDADVHNDADGDDGSNGDGDDGDGVIYRPLLA